MNAMNFRLQISLFIILIWYTVGDATSLETGSCLVDDKNPYPYYATRSSYKNVGSKEEFKSIPGCTPVKLWILIRHASRYPSASKIKSMEPILYKLRDKIIENYQNVTNGLMCKKDVENLQNWTYNFTKNLGDSIMQEGLDDLSNLAKRLKDHFPNLFNATYTPRLFQFKTSNESQAMESGEQFIKDLFNITDKQEKLPYIGRDQNLLHPQMVCPKWVEMVNSEAMTTQEAQFLQQSEVSNMIDGISKRLGFKHNITYDTVKTIYGICRYENVLFDRLNSPFCAAFTEDDLKIMEYIEDVHRYYQDGHGNYVDKKIGCPLVKDFIEKFKEPDNDDPVTVFFGHSGTVMQLVAALGIKNGDLPLMHDNYLNMTKREWRTSLIAPFNANFIAVLYECKSGGRQIKFYLNESPVSYPECDNVTNLCSLEYISSKFLHFINPKTCNLDFCFANENPTQPLGYAWIIKWTVIVTMALIFLYLLIFRISKIKSISSFWNEFRKSSEYSPLD